MYSIRGWRQVVGLIAVAVLVPGGGLVVLATLLTRRVWQRWLPSGIYSLASGPLTPRGSV